MSRNRAKLHDLTHSPAGLWQLDGLLKDESGNGFDLVVATGTERYSVGAVPERKSGYFDSTVLDRATHDASLLILGDVTLEVLVYPTTNDSGLFRDILDFCGPSEVLADNCPWYIGLSGSNNSPRWFHEYSPAADETFIWSAVSIPTFQWTHLAMVRDDSAKTVTLYVNGLPDPVVFNYANSAAGGTTSVLQIGGWGFTGVQLFEGLLNSCKVIPSALTAVQVLAESERSLAARAVNMYTPPLLPEITPDNHANITLWHRADQNDTDDSDTVTTPTLLAGANGVTQATAAERPFVHTAGGQSSWRMTDGAGTALWFDGAALSNYIASTPAFHVYCAFLIEDATLDAVAPEDNHRLFGDDLGNWGAYARRLSATTVQIICLLNDGSDNLTTHTVSLGEMHLLEFWFDAGSMRSRIDDGSEDATATGAISSVANIIEIGGQDEFIGSINDIVLANALDTGTRAGIRNYFKNRFGMDV